jgi:hypothetical protein
MPATIALPVKTRDDSLLTAEIRVHGVDGSIQSFTQHEESLVKHIRQEASRSPDDSVMALLEVVVVGGQRLFLAQEIPASPSGEHLPGFDSLFTASSFSFLMRTGGIAVLNVANLARFTIYPGPLQIWEEVWPANHGGGRDRDSHDGPRFWGVDEREAA